MKNVLINKWDVEHFIGQIALIVLFSSTVFPPLRAIGNSYVISSLALIIWFFIAALTMRESLKKITTSKALAFFAVMIIASFSLVASNSTMANRYLNLILIFVGFQIFMTYKESGELHRLKPVIIIALLSAFITYSRTFELLVSNPWVARSLKSTGEYTRALSLQGIGGYEFVYFAALFGILAFFMGLSIAKKTRFIWFSVTALVFIFVLWASYITALVILIFGIVLVLIFFFATSKHTSIGERLLALVPACLILLALLSPGNPLGQMLNDLLGKTRITQVLSSGSFFQNLGGEFFVDRFPTIEKSWETFQSFPLLGSVFGLSSSGATSVIESAGQHSFFADSFAYFGFIIGTLVLVTTLAPFFEMIHIGYPKGIIIPIAICTFILLSLNNATPSIAFVSMLCLPYFCERQSQSKSSSIQEK